LHTSPMRRRGSFWEEGAPSPTLTSLDNHQ
jgi:hypothetical protein